MMRKSAQAPLVVATATLLGLPAAFAESIDNIASQAGGRIRVDVGSQQESGGAWLRLRELQVEGTLSLERARLRAEFDVADRVNGWRNLWAEYRPFDRVLVRVGNQVSGFGLQESSGSSSSPFFERPLSAGLLPGLRPGMLVQGYDKSWTLRFALMDEGALGRRVDRRGIGAREYVVRGVVRSMEGDRPRLAVGATWADSVGRAEGRLQFRGLDESAFEDAPVVRSAALAMPARIRTRGVEFAWALPSLALTGEDVLVKASGTNAWERAAYVAASWFPWGGERVYQAGAATFEGVSMPRGIRPIEVAARASRLSVGDAFGGRSVQSSVALAVDWHFAPLSRLMVQISRGRVSTHSGRHEDRVAQVRFQVGYNSAISRE